MAKQEKLIDHPPSGALGTNLRHLHVLCAVAQAGSIAQAAEGLFRVPSAVARSITELEAVLGVPLFERRARGMVPNRHGDIVLTRARRIEQAFDEARQQLMARSGVRSSADVHTLFASIMNGRRLAVIASLAEQRSMASVAREFDITQPAISAAVKDLETRLAITLFERTARGLVPTPAGEILAFHFKRVLAELRHIAPDLAASEGTLQGSIHVGALPLGRTHILPMAIASLLARHPQLHVGTVESPYEALAASLRSGDVDFILGALRGPEGTKELEQQSLFEDRLSIIARAGHPLARARPLDFDTLRRARWVLSRHGSPSRELFETFFSDARQPPPIPAVETGDLAVLRGLLRESDMLTAISAHQLRYEIRDGSLVVLDFPLEPTRRQIGLSQRLGALPSPGALALMAEIRNVVTQSEEFDTPERAARG
ncbi:LysR family transcriptional regulator [Rhizobacter sp. Root1221]|uniref:LysR family transcriptional regulator n=1 Tax=Rhizobacter sp. Root1221 TaxID=1736433 RepID=UPI0006F3A4B7|nr:LysR family transcriptional regulator [Rhizobacter sp. Root1221]KQW01206.1 LysR family transcriptional regulator [Rhizobacter sp. Root1221]